MELLCPYQTFSGKNLSLEIVSYNHLAYMCMVIYHILSGVISAVCFVLGVVNTDKQRGGVGVGLGVATPLPFGWYST